MIHKTVWIDVEANKADLHGAFSRAMQRDPVRVVFIGSAPKYEALAKESGHEVEVVAAGTAAPVDASVVLPLA